MYPEYTGVLYSNKILANLGDRPASATSTYAGAKTFLAKGGCALLAPTPFQDADGVAVTNDFAKKNNLKTIDDPKSSSHSRTRAEGEPEPLPGRSRPEAGVRAQRPRVQGAADRQPVHALDRTDVDSIAIFTTDAQLASNRYTVMTDTKGSFGFQQVAPIVKRSVLDAEGPEFERTLNAVSALLTTDSIIVMNKESRSTRRSSRTSRGSS